LAIVFSGVGLYKLNSGFARVINTVAEITNDSSVKKNNENASSLNRICMWKIAEMLIAEKPIFGHGVKSYNRVKNDWLHNPKNSISNISSCRLTEVETLTNYNNAHNAFIHTWVELGIFGVIVFVLFLFTPVFYFIKNIRNYTGNINTLGWFGLSSQILWILNSMTENITGRSLVFIFMLFNLVLLYTFTENIKNKKT
jgi:O-antigen ligase